MGIVETRAGGWLFAPSRRIVLAGIVFGTLAALLTKWGNPPNMGICVACFLRDIAGGLGLHRAGVVQYLRPEIMGFVLGALLSSFVAGEFHARGGSSPLARLFLGAFVMVGSLVFLGCPVRATLRLAGGDLSGIVGLAGVVVGTLPGIFLLRRGFNLGRARSVGVASGLLLPLAVVALLLAAIFHPPFIFASEKGPGALHAPLAISLIAGLLVGTLAQRTRMCFVGGWRDLFLVMDRYLFSGIAAFFVAALVVNLAMGSVKLGFAGQPVAHTSHTWNFLGMALVGLAATLLGGCPLRQLILTGEGDSDAAITVVGLVVGAGISHNFLLASTPAGPSLFGQVAVLVGLAFCLCIGGLMREA